MCELPERMQAVVCHGPQDYRYQQVATPQPGPDDVIIKIAACGICASDCKCKRGADMFWQEPAYVQPPVIAGHEFYGYVAALGERAGASRGLTIGDRVIAEQIVPCQQCRFCLNGQYWMCEVHNIYGFQREVAEGGMAEYMRLSERARLHKIPQSLSHEDAAMIEPLACAVHCVNRADIQFEDVVVIAGLGPLGLGMVQAARLKTPGQLIAIDTQPERLALAEGFGAKVLLNPGETDVVAQVKNLTGGYGCDVYIEATGHPSGVTQGMQMIRKLGRFVEFSVFAAETSLDWSVIGDRKELDVRGAHLSPYCYPVTIDLLRRGLLTSKGIVTHSFPLAQAEEAFALADSSDSIKVLLQP